MTEKLEPNSAYVDENGVVCLTDENGYIAAYVSQELWRDLLADAEKLEATINAPGGDA